MVGLNITEITNINDLHIYIKETILESLQTFVINLVKNLPEQSDGGHGGLSG